METKQLHLYHGSPVIVAKPIYGFGKSTNDYGRGFYCTESPDLAKEWACPTLQDGYANCYCLPLKGLNVIRLDEKPFHLLNWLAVLLNNRSFTPRSNIGVAAKQYILNHFLPDLSGADVIIGYRADDSYFSFANDFLENTISLRDLHYAMKLGRLGKQVVLVSKKAFDALSFEGAVVADSTRYYHDRARRDLEARTSYFDRKADLVTIKDDVFVLDMIREEMKENDPRLQRALSR